MIHTMKNRFIPVLLIAVLLSGCSTGSEENAISKGIELYFEEPVHDYGELPKDGDGTWIFRCKNLGEEAIVINRVRSTCGCTVPQWPREPLEPGSTGEIVVKYNTAQTGTFMKSLYVYSTAANTPVKLQIKGKVLPEAS
ncbi:MAG: hypothetical protein CSA96_08560 [Bacteroidetes bacterium]|nr:MAG: hypothetical protein CSA96_08560 [Bacteroidota bacterium]